ncbi:MAG: alkaline phosphatase [Bacteroidota bacterium]
MKKFSLLSITLLFWLCPVSAQQERPSNIVMMIGDGMGIAQVTAGHTKKGRLELQQFRHLGLLLTHAYGPDYITDSAAAATALSTGVATLNGMIGMGPDSVRRETVLERAQKRGMKTGIVTVCSITHATPASYIAHVPSRNMHVEIALQIAGATADLYLGSGWGWFLPKTSGGRRTDGRDLLSEMRMRGFTVALSDSAFRVSEQRKISKLIGLFAEEHVGNAQTRTPRLAELTAYALKTLSGREGFFLLVEGSQIDWASHDNQSDQVMAEMADFDDAIGEVVKYAKGNPGTLIIVTADHETGGYAIVNGSCRDRTIQGDFAVEDHTGEMVPLFAMGPGAEKFTGIRPNTDVGKILLKILE